MSEPMVRNHVLESGLLIRQDIKESVRFVFFETDTEEWPYATHCGTAFVVNFRGRPYGITCRHVLHDFGWRQMVITDKKFGTNIAGLKSVAYPSAPTGGAEHSDILDVAVLQFADDVGVKFFEDAAYILDRNSVAKSEVGHVLAVNGNLKETTTIGEGSIAPVFAFLDFHDRGSTSADPALREARGKYENPDFTSLAGLSGSPVFNVTANGFCGMVVRAGLDENTSTMWYVDAFDIMRLLEAVHEGQGKTYYTKTIARLVPEA